MKKPYTYTSATYTTQHIRVTNYGLKHISDTLIYLKEEKTTQ